MRTFDRVRTLERVRPHTGPRHRVRRPPSSRRAGNAQPPDADPFLGATARGSGSGSSVPTPARASAVAAMWRLLAGEDLPARLVLWDGSSSGASDAPATVVVHSPAALRRILWSPDELGMARAFIAGDIDIEGDLLALLAAMRRHLGPGDVFGVLRALPTVWRAARLTGGLGLPLRPPPEEARHRGKRHSRGRDAAAIAHHYDVGNDFYRLLLGPSMTYSCARWVDGTGLDPDDDPAAGLEAAQAAKHELICRKLGVHERPGTRLLDVGCGWGSLALHAARRHGARVVGITISAQQAHLARQRVREAGLEHLVDIRLQDYRDLSGERFDAISSVGMFEHVGRSRMADYLGIVAGLLAPGGRLLNHAISTPGNATMTGHSFVGRYVFPDGELIDVGDVVLGMEAAGLEVRDVESLREHYGRTLRAWIANLERHWDDAVRLVGPARARVWRLYLTGSVAGFDDAGLSIHQVLAVRPHADGSSGVPPTRAGWETAAASAAVLG